MAASGSKKKNSKAQTGTSTGGSRSSYQGEITNSKDLKEFLLSIRDRMEDDQASPVNVISVMN